ELVRPAGVVAEGLGAGRDVDVAALGEGLAVVERLELRQLVAVLLDQVGDLEEQALALTRVHARPSAVVERAARGARSAIDVLLVALRDPREHLARGGVDGLERLPRGRL